MKVVQCKITSGEDHVDVVWLEADRDISNGLVVSFPQSATPEIHWIVDEIYAVIERRPQTITSVWSNEV